ncbi:MAG: hypothetical protein HW402_39 [Dehalococcoidales bacterium]|nr:hypothetical protein [Dehalococcoidales bacterium]
MFHSRCLTGIWWRGLRIVVLLALVATSVGALARVALPPAKVAGAEGTRQTASIVVTDSQVLSLAPVPGATVHFIPGNKVRVTYLLSMEISLGVTGGRLWLSGMPQAVVEEFARTRSYVSATNPDWVWKFTVGASGNVTVITPVDGLATKSTTPTFDWSSLSNPAILRYAIEISNSKNFSNPILSVVRYTSEGTSYTLTPAQALPNGDYYWRLIAKDTMWVVSIPPWLDIRSVNPFVTELPTFLSVETQEGKLTATYTYILAPPPPPPSGGGGGGGIPSPPPLPPGTTSIADKIGAGGIITQLFTVPSPDNKFILLLGSGVKALTRDGLPLDRISVTERADVPALPAESRVVGVVYDLGPDGATFEPAVTVELAYDMSRLPEGVAEDKLVVATWEASSGKWVVLEGAVVNISTRTITVKVSHFSSFAVLAYTRPAAFTVTDMALSPLEVDPVKTVTASVLVKNTGDLPGSYKVALKINGAQVDTKEVTLAGGASETVSFTVVRDVVGTYSVEIGGQAGKFVVRAQSVPPAPAAFTLSSLVISPPEVGIKEPVTISVVVKNSGALTASQKMTLTIGGTIMETRDVTLGGGASEKVTFTVSRDSAGSYAVDVNGLTGGFTVQAVAPPPLPPPPPARQTSNRGLIGGIIVALIVIGGGIVLVARQRRA